MSILDEILEQKRAEVASRRQLFPEKLLEQSPSFSAPIVSLRKYIERPDLHGIIAEIKRKSPSAGVLDANITIEKLSVGYMQAGASALSVLTDERYFGGALKDLKEARTCNFCPILRKDFVVDRYQILEARAYGADAILLIAAALSPTETESLAAVAKSLGLEVLLEIHEESELGHLCEGIDLVGVNSRNLKTMTVDLDTAVALVDKLPAQCARVAESGIHRAADYARLKEAGYQGFLIGEQFMRTGDPPAALRAFIRDVRRLGAA